LPVKKALNSSDSKNRAHRAMVSLRRIMTSAKRHLAAQVEEAEGSTISGAQLWALWHVKANPGLTVLDLAGHLSVHQSTTSNLVEKLESAGCLRRERSAHDKRVVQLFVTPAGAQLLKSAPNPTGGALSDALNRLSGKDLAALETALDSLSRELGIAQKNGKRSITS
jgi:DNA-binding MarR family transcriptional regulator